MSQSHENEEDKVVQPTRSLSPNSTFNKKTKRGNFILRQEMNSLTPECNPKCGIIFNTCLLILFLSIGMPIVFYTNETKEVRIYYTDCSVKGRNDTYFHNSTTVSNQCKLTFNLNETLVSPIFFYYELEDFFLNHRYLVKSRIWSQLRGEKHVDSTKNSKCEGAIYMQEMFDNQTSKYKTFWDKPLTGHDFANPCGLVAKSFFTDSYELFNSSGKNITINEKGIANYYEKKKSFKRLTNHSDVQWMDVENEHFIVWMSMETYNSFRKLWGKIERDLKPDNYTIIVHENYNTTKFNSKKAIVLSTSSPLGTSCFLGYLLLSGAIYCLLTILILWVLLIMNGDKKFDYSVMKWK